MKSSYDVIVIGAGTAGVIAAIQSARAGAETLLVEKSAMPGGTMTSGGIAFPGLFYAWGKQIIAGIGWELVTQSASEANLPLPDFTAQNGMERHWLYQVRINPLIHAALCDEKLLASKVDILYHTMPGIIRNGIVTLCTKTGLHDVKVKVIVDCTGDANAARMNGAEIIEHEETQPGTYSIRTSGYDPATLDYEAIRNNARRAVEAGELEFTDMSWNASDFSAQLLSTFGNNANHLWGKNADSSEGRTDMEIQGRKSILRAWRFLRQQSGLEKLKFEFGASECGIRETVTIRGNSIISVEDYVSGRRYPDAVCNAFYPVDLHNREHGVCPEALCEGVVPCVPLSALIPAGTQNMITAGRCISSDRPANSALRVQCTCMATGQAAGAAAALSAKLNLPVPDVPIEQIKNLLREHNAIVPE